MSWVKETLTRLRDGKFAQVRPHGDSMRGRIQSRQLVTIAPATIVNLSVNDVVFVRWRDNYLLHVVMEIEADRILIGNNVGKINGRTSAECVLGKVVAVSD